jgi:hypothetical protein
MEANEFQCELCRGIYEKGWSEDDAKAEFGKDFPGFQLSDAGLICEDCYNKINPAVQLLIHNENQ